MCQIMPKITYKNKDFYLRWPEGSDHQIFMVAKRYGSWELHHFKKTNEYRRIFIVDWKRAEKAGALKGLPNLTRLQIAKRYGELKRRYNDPDYLVKKAKQNKKYARKKWRKHESFFNRLRVWKEIPDEIKKKYGHNPRQVWTDEQKKLLLQIAKDYIHTNVDWKKVIKDPKVNELPVSTIPRLASYYHGLQERTTNKLSWTKKQVQILTSLGQKHTKSEIDWPGLMKDRRLKKLPEKYANDLHHLRKYYWNVARKDRNSPEYIKRHREDALRWKRENIDRYYENQYRRTKMINNAVNEFLNKKIGKRK